MIELKGVSFQYDGSTPILKDINLELKKGESLGILGPNGGGKSTLLKILAGIIRPSSGLYSFNGVNYTAQQHHNQISYIPQHQEINTTLPLTISELLSIEAELTNTSLSGLNELMKKVGLDVSKDTICNVLSRGQLQKVYLMKSIIKKPKLLILDEPNTGLDSYGQDQLLRLLEKMKGETTIVMVDHNMSTLIKNCDKILCLNKTSHWHDHKDGLTKEIIEGIYHCEFEHLAIHDQKGQEVEHHLCHTHGKSEGENDQ